MHVLVQAREKVATNIIKNLHLLVDIDCLHIISAGLKLFSLKQIHARSDAIITGRGTVRVFLHCL